MNAAITIRSAMLLLLSAPLCVQAQQGQTQPSAPVPAASAPLLSVPGNGSNEGDANFDTTVAGDRMLTPPPVSGQSYPLAPSSEEKANYIRGGVIFDAAYSDNVLGSTSATPVSDVSYSVFPTVTLDETTTRLHTLLTYAPGFTFYQRTSGYNQADQNVSIDLRYRLSPHVTVSLRDSLQKTSNVFNQPDQGLGVAVSGSAQALNNSIVAPLADQLSNTGGAGITYQYGADSMIGASGTFTNLHYANPSQVPGLFDGATRAGSAFYAHRLSPRNYIGATYQYQELLAYPTGGTNQTQTHGILAFYTFFPATHFSVSVFGGPQYYNSGVQIVAAGVAPIPAANAWTPAAGASLNWRLPRGNVALSYLHTVSGGSGLAGAVELDSAAASVGRQITPNLSAHIAASYANNGVLAVSTLGGHSALASAALERQVGQHVGLQAGYTRLHQTYYFFSANPDTNREWVSVSYQFSRPLGR